MQKHERKRRESAHTQRPAEDAKKGGGEGDKDKRWKARRRWTVNGTGTKAAAVAVGSPRVNVSAKLVGGDRPDTWR